MSGGSLDPQGPVAAAMADLWWLMLWLGTAVFAVFAAALAWGLIRRRSGADPRAPRTPSPDRGRWFVGAGVIAPLIVLVVVFGATVQAMRVIPDDAAPGDLAIELVGHQWWYEVTYPEAGFTTANELHVPVGRQVALELTSADVIHSFWVPALAGKIDLLPDHPNTLVLQADQPGEYPAQCAEFCGLQHANMQLVVVAQPAAEFDRWVADRQEPAARPATSATRRGQELFQATCAACHTVAGTPAAGADGPDLTHFASRPSIGAGVLPNSAEHLAGWVADPGASKPGVEMPPADLAEDDLAALLAYLATLR